MCTCLKIYINLCAYKYSSYVFVCVKYLKANIVEDCLKTKIKPQGWTITRDNKYYWPVL